MENDYSTDNSILFYQAYNDAWDDYKRSLNNSGFPVWDYVFLTASNRIQAAEYEKQIEIRKDFLPSRTRFIVVPDEGDLRVGSGGATLSVIKRFFENELSFNHKRILVIHSGGDSKRIPQYSAIGKLFSPVPHCFPDSRLSTLFDEIIVSLSSLPGRIKEGMLLYSGDALLFFNSLFVSFSGYGAAAISFKENVLIGKEHGVFTVNENGNVKSFLHKKSEDELRKAGAVDDDGNINIDTGAIILGVDILNSLWSLISTDNEFDSNKYKKYVNSIVRLSLYGDVQYPMASESSLEQFLSETPEGDFSDELTICRTEIWSLLHNYRIRLISIPNAKFLHFGTSTEILELVNKHINSYSSIGWSKNTNSISNKAPAYNSIVSDKAIIGENCYIENSIINSNAVIGSGSIVSSVCINGGVVIPENVVLHALKLNDGKYVCRIFGIKDNPKTNKLFGKELPFNSLWDAPIYPECDSMDEAVIESLKIFDLQMNGVLQTANYTSQCKSLCSGFNDADIMAVLDWNKRISEKYDIEIIEESIRKSVPAHELKKLNHLTDNQKEYIKTKLDNSDFSHKIRLNYYVGSTLDGEDKEKYIGAAFKTVTDAILTSSLTELKKQEGISIKKETFSVSLPLRVNWGGGWSDTPPYCSENGGTVLNASVLLNDKEPVTVTVKRLFEKKVVFESRDMGVYGEFNDIKELQKLGDPYDPFALQKAALVSCGIIPNEGGNLENILSEIGGGFLIDTEVIDVPKGSGLGTSSILAAACIKALFGFFDIESDDSELIDTVLCMEQLMSTGGGWQDQIGGLVKGIKLIKSEPGLKQNISVEKISVEKSTIDELQDRFTLIYTGQRRLARNLLRDVICRYIGNEPDSIYSLNQIQTIALKMKDELVNGDIDKLASLFNEHWELSKMIDSGSTNILIDSIFECIDDLIDGKMICGAGGGGFLQVIIKKGVSKEKLDERLKQRFPKTGIAVWNCTIV